MIHAQPSDNCNFFAKTSISPSFFFNHTKMNKIAVCPITALSLSNSHNNSDSASSITHENRKPTMTSLTRHLNGEMPQLSEELIRSSVGATIGGNSTGLILCADSINILNMSTNNDAMNQSSFSKTGSVQNHTSSSSSSSSSSSISSSNNNNDASSNTSMDKKKMHNCPYCDRSFTRPYRLNDHISFSHTDEV